jgi:hypothetical protein
LNRGEIIIYQTPNGETQLDVRLEGETVWLMQEQIAFLFGTKRPAITKHLGNIFNSRELDENSVCSILEHTAADGKNYRTKFYNLDAILSVGYRVNSKNATAFRIWANRVLKDYLIKGYANCLNCDFNMIILIFMINSRFIEHGKYDKRAVQIFRIDFQNYRLCNDCA